MTTFDTGNAQDLLGPLLECLQDDRRDLLRRVFLIAERDRDLLAHFPLDRSDRSVPERAHTGSRGLADQQVALGIQADDRRQDRVAVLLEDDGPAITDDRHLAIGRSQVDADDRVVFMSSFLARSASGRTLLDS